MATNRMSGMISGLDTEALVKQMMALSQNKYDNLMKKKTESEWKKQLYNDIYKDLKSLDDKLFSATLSNYSNPKTATSSNSAVATVTASSAATNGSYTLKVKELATNANLNGKLDSATLADLGLTTGMKLSVTGSNGTKDIEITDKMTTVNDLVSAINKANLGITANYDNNSGNFFLKSTSTGKAAKIELELKDTNGAVTGTDFLKALDPNSDTGKVSVSGQNAVIELDGARIEQSTNDFNLFGMAFSLKSKSEDVLKVEVKSDTSKLVENVKSLIETYNNLISMINEKTSEKYYRNYSPLTDEQRKEMTEKEIELWEEKAKSGILRNDSILTGLTSKMRTAMYSSYNINGKYKTLSSLGIATSNYQDKGVLTIDEEKLTKALEEDPNAVSKLFSGDGGLVDTLRGSIKEAMKQIEKTAGGDKKVDTESSLAKQISNYTDKMSFLAKKMVTEENRYYSQFTAMEKTLSKMNSNSSYLMSMFGS